MRTENVTRATYKRRLGVVRQVVERRLSAAEAARQLGLSERQVYRLAAKVRAGESGDIRHGNVGREPANKIDDGLWHEVLRLVRDRYMGLSVRTIRQALMRDHGIDVGRESLRKRLRAAGIEPAGRGHASSFRGMVSGVGAR